MSEIKTLTINGKTYTVSDADSVSFEEEQDLSADQQARARDNIGAACIDDAKVGADAWSSQKTSEEMDRSISVARLETIDKLCPSFTESGSVAVCEPVEGYPLGVTSRIEPVQKGSGDPYPPGGGKNFARADSTRTVDVDAGIVVKTTVNTAEIVVNGTATKNHSMSLFYNIALPAGTYTASVWGLVDADYLNCETADGGYPVQGLHSGTPKTFTISEEITIKIAAVFVSGSAYNNATVKIQIEPGETATEYAPYSNIRPISGHSAVKLTRCGKNLIGTEIAKAINGTESHVSFDNDVYTIDFISGGQYVAYKPDGYNEIVFPAGTYTVSLVKVTESVNMSVLINSLSNERIAFSRLGDHDGFYTYTFTTTEPFVFRLCGHYVSDLSTYGKFSFKIQLEAGSTATEYEPYQGDNFTLDLGQTVYGGSLDWNSGVLTITNKGVAMKDLVWSLSSGNTTFEASVDGGKMGNYYGVHCLCSMYSVVSPETTTDWHDVENITKGTSNDIIVGSYYNAGCKTMVGNSRGQTLEEFTAELAESDAFLVYRLAEPVTIQLTPQEITALSGINALYSDTGETQVTGRADPRVVIQDQQELINRILDRVAALEAAAVNNT